MNHVRLTTHSKRGENLAFLVSIHDQLRKMFQTNAKGILLDIEGTTSSISFVYDVMFPYVRNHVAEFLQSNWEQPGVMDCLPLLASDLELDSADAWLDSQSNEQKRSAVVQGVIQLMDADVKATGLKQLQGLIWKAGFQSGEMVAHLFDDVPGAIEVWSDQGMDIRIYSSGSIAAQKLFFGHTIAGNLLDRFSGHYDTTTGPKKESDSYVKITTAFGLQPSQILFVSDVVEELTAAQNVGLQTVLSIRPGNKPVPADHTFQSVSSFAEIQITS